MHRGRISLKLNGVTYPVKYDWGVLAQLRERFGDEYTGEVFKAVDSEDVNTLAEITSISIDGALSADEIRKLSPSLIAIIEAIRQGINVAYYGTVEPPDPIRAGVIASLRRWAMLLLPRNRPRTLEG